MNGSRQMVKDIVQTLNDAKLDGKNGECRHWIMGQASP